VSSRREPSAISIALGRRVKKLREKKGWTQADLAAASGLERSHISEIENGHILPNIVTLQTLAKSLHVTMSVLLKGL
jgi:transcriptional regulator with XRE-family HTH domain